MTKAILFDFWGTLVEAGVWSPLKQVKGILEVKIPFSNFVNRVETAMMTKPYESLTEAFKNVLKEFEIKPDQTKIETLIGMWNKSWMLARPYEETIEILTELKKKYKLILISNSDSISLPLTLKKFDLAQYFHKMFFSFELGMIKTDSFFLQNVLSGLKLLPRDCLVVGDSLESDIAAAVAAGIPAILIDRKDTRTYINKIKTLREIYSFL